MGGGWILSKQFLNGSDYIHCLAPPADTDGQADAAVFSEISACGHLWSGQTESQSPHVMWVLGSQQRSGTICWLSALSLARQGALKPFLPPEPLHPLVIVRPARQSQAPVDQPSAPAPMAPGQFPNSIAELLLLNLGQWHGASLSIAILTR